MEFRGKWLTVHDQLVGDGVVAERVFNVARVFPGVGAVHLLDEQGSFGQLAQSVARLEHGPAHFPRHFRRGYTNGQARQFHVLFVGGRELVVERRDLCRY